jgi:hypothetical protein
LHHYQAFISDVAGQHIHSHNGSLNSLIEQIAAWLRDEVGEPDGPGGRAIAAEFERFRLELPQIAAAKPLELDELTFKDLAAIAAAWILAETGAA